MLQYKKYDKSDCEQEGNEYKYLIKMPMDSVTEENVQKLLMDKGNKETELLKIKTITNQQMWLNELNILSQEYESYTEDRQRQDSVDIKKPKVVKKKIVIVN